MKHFLFLVKEKSFRMGLCKDGGYNSLAYGGDGEIHWKKEDASFWRSFWQYLLELERIEDWREMSLTIICRERIFAELGDFLRVPLGKDLGELSIQNISSVLPQIACKAGLLHKGKQALIVWENGAWQVDNTAAKEVSIETTLSAYKFTDHEITKYMAAPWPVQGEAEVSVIGSGRSDTVLARRVQESKIC